MTEQKLTRKFRTSFCHALGTIIKLGKKTLHVQKEKLKFEKVFKKNFEQKKLRKKFSFRNKIK